ncbi:MAG: rhomboid family intramembrane serine protease [Micrococcales bacterium]|nr:rhomboid family intramembrane serine protease [Micrococcales bacterium]
MRESRRTTPAVRSVFGAPLGQGLPYITIGAIALNVVMWVVNQVVGASMTVDFAFWPLAARAEPWRFISGAFMHANLLHLALNMYCLWVVGSFLEQILGRARYSVLFLASALGGNMAVLAWAQVASHDFYGLTVGASGAVFGLFGAMLVLGRKLGRELSGIATVVGLNLVLSFTIPGISWQGHVGGLLIGAALAAVYAFAPAAKRQLWAWLGGVGVFGLLVLAWLLLIPGLPLR